MFMEHGCALDKGGSNLPFAFPSHKQHKPCSEKAAKEEAAKKAAEEKAEKAAAEKAAREEVEREKAQKAAAVQALSVPLNGVFLFVNPTILPPGLCSFRHLFNYFTVIYLFGSPRWVLGWGRG